MAQPESVRLQGTAIDDILTQTIQIRPTIANRFIYLDVTPTIPSGEYQGQIINLQGQQVHAFSFRHSGTSEIPISVLQLGSGIYFVRFQKGPSYYLGKFIKQ